MSEKKLLTRCYKGMNFFIQNRVKTFTSLEKLTAMVTGNEDYFN